MSSEQLSTSREVLIGEVDQQVVLAAPLDTVWAAFSRLEIRDRWFKMPGSAGVPHARTGLPRRRRRGRDERVPEHRPRGAT